MSTQSDHVAELERQRLIKEAHSLVAAIATRPGSTKLLKGVIPILEMYASYKSNRQRLKRYKRSELPKASPPNSNAGI